MDWISGIFQAVKLPIKIIVGIVIFIFLLLIIPEELILFLGIESILNDYRGYFSLVFIGGFVFLIINFSLLLFRYIQKKIHQKNSKEKIERLKGDLMISIESLDTIEKGVIREFILSGQNTIELPITNASVSSLLSKNILSIAGNYEKHTIFGILKPLKIYNYVFEILRPDHIDIPLQSLDHGENLSEQEMRRLSELRPDFILKLDRFRQYLG